MVVILVLVVVIAGIIYGAIAYHNTEIKKLTLALLMLRVFANYPKAPFATNPLALKTHWFY